MDLWLYWWMFPVAIGVAALAMASGIGGAALFAPIFMLLFPILGPEYALESAATAVGVALAIELFGFSSGVLGYLRRHLIHFPTAGRILRVAVPMAIAGALVSHFIPSVLVRAAYALLMFILTLVMLRTEKSGATSLRPASEIDAQQHDDLIDSAGKKYHFKHIASKTTMFITSIGAFMTGLVSVGIGEVTVSQLTKGSKVPLPVAAGTSVLVVAVTVLVSSFVHISTVIVSEGLGGIPLNLLLFAIPGVVIGGQIGSRLQGVLPERVVEIGIATLFGLIGVVMVISILL